MMATNVTQAAQAEVLTRLDEVATMLTQSALDYLKGQPPGAPVLCEAFVMQQSGQTTLLGIGDPNLRLDALRKIAAAMNDVVGFALIFDGYVSRQCRLCNSVDACEHLGGGARPRCDAIIAVVRTVWGAGFTRSRAYGYTKGRFELRPDRDESTPGTAETLDNYDTVFRKVAVH